MHKDSISSHPVEAWLAAFDSQRQGESNGVCLVVIPCASLFRSWRLPSKPGPILHKVSTSSHPVEAWLAAFDSQRQGESNGVCLRLVERGGAQASWRLPSKPGPILHKVSTSSHPVEAWLAAFDSQRQGESNGVCPVVIRGG